MRLDVKREAPSSIFILSLALIHPLKGVVVENESLYYCSQEFFKKSLKITTHHSSQLSSNNNKQHLHVYRLSHKSPLFTLYFISSRSFTTYPLQE
jgi:hypothetical protein